MKRFVPHPLSATFALVASLLLAAPASAEDLSEWRLPPVPVPEDNPQTNAKISLGHQLVFDTRLSKNNNSINCVGCHVPDAGGAGFTPRAFGHGGELGRWAPSWIASGYYETLFWDGRAESLEQQTGLLPGHIGPVSSPDEMAGDVERIVRVINDVPGYRRQFEAVFGGPATRENIARAIASFQRTLVPRRSPFQRYVNGEKNAIPPAAKRGFELFRGKAQCTVCHTPPLMTDNNFHNIGVPQVGPLAEDEGRYAVTGAEEDTGAFKTPTLYNSASFAFFMHDGAFATLEEVIDHYDRGGDPSNPNQSALITPLELTDREKADLVAFLESLTDESLNNIRRPELP